VTELLALLVALALAVYSEPALDKVDVKRLRRYERWLLTQQAVLASRKQSAGIRKLVAKTSEQLARARQALGERSQQT